MAALLNPARLGRLKTLGSLVSPRGRGVVPRPDECQQRQVQVTVCGGEKAARRAPPRAREA